MVGGKEPLLKVAVGAVAIDFEHHASDALGEGVVVSALGMGVGGESLLGDVVGKFCDMDKSALSQRLRAMSAQEIVVRVVRAVRERVSPLPKEPPNATYTNREDTVYKNKRD